MNIFHTFIDSISIPFPLIFPPSLSSSLSPTPSSSLAPRHPRPNAQSSRPQYLHSLYPLPCTLSHRYLVRERETEREMVSKYKIKWSIRTAILVSVSISLSLSPSIPLFLSLSPSLPPSPPLSLSLCLFLHPSLTLPNLLHFLVSLKRHIFLFVCIN